MSHTQRKSKRRVRVRMKDWQTNIKRKRGSERDERMRENCMCERKRERKTAV